MSKREAKRHDDDEEDDDDDDEISSSSGGDDDSGSDEEMSESEEESGNKVTGGGKGGQALDKPIKAGNERSLANQPFDEAMDLSESEGSVSEGHDSPKKTIKTLKNQPFDEALELSGSVQDLESPHKSMQQQQQQQQHQRTAGQERDKHLSASHATAAKPQSSSVGMEMKNKPFDEEMDLSDSGDSVDTNGQPSPDSKSMKAAKQAQAAGGASTVKYGQPVASEPKPTAASTAATTQDRKPAPSAKDQASATKATPVAMTASKQPEKKAPEPKRKEQSESSSEESDSEEEDEEDDEGEESQAGTAGAGGGATAGAGGGGSSNHAAILANAASYKESDFAHLKVSSEIRELFQYIGRFKAQEIELETRLKCFIPEYIPAVGDMDAFLKIPRPDGELDYLGLKMLDEPSLSQSDATVLDLQLRSTSKKKHGDIVVRSIENAEKTPKDIDKWIKSIADLHRTKPPPQVHYTKTMPDIESLMQVWPEEFEELLSKTPLPSASMDMALEQYIRVICALLDIPVYKNIYESLHVLFTLYLEFRSNQHFMNYDGQAMLEPTAQAPPPFTARRSEATTPDEFSYRN